MAPDDSIDISDVVDADRLEVREASESIGLNGERPITAMTCPVRTAGVTSGDSERRYIVEVEFRPEDYLLSPESFLAYLRSYNSLSVTQDGLTLLIRRDLKERLELDDVFVEVSYSQAGEKRTRYGEV